MAEPEVTASNDVTTENYDAEQMKEDISAGEEKAPKVNVEADYERSKQFDVAEIDRSAEGARAAAEATEPNVKHSSLSSFSAQESTGTEAGNPDTFREMAKEVNHTQKQ